MLSALDLISIELSFKYKIIKLSSNTKTYILSLQKINTMQGFMGLFKKSNAHDRHIAEISGPTNVVHDIHVGKNAHGELEGKITWHPTNWLEYCICRVQMSIDTAN